MAVSNYSGGSKAFYKRYCSLTTLNYCQEIYRKCLNWSLSIWSNGKACSTWYSHAKNLARKDKPTDYIDSVGIGAIITGH